MSLEKLKHELLGKAIDFVGNDAQRVDDTVLTKLDHVRLESLEWMLNLLDQENIAGDIIEAGVWRGGAAIWMRNISPARTVWCCDTFAGFPLDSEPYRPGVMSASLPDVQYHVNRLADPRRFKYLVGDFRDTLPGGIGKIALLHFDGDSPRATRNVLDALYSRTVPGAFVVIDDYCLRPCKLELHAWFNKRNLAKPLDITLMDPYTAAELAPHATPCGLWWRK